MLTSAGPLVSLIAGILILVVPRLLNYIVAIYLIVIGLLGLFGSHTFTERAFSTWETTRRTGCREAETEYRTCCAT